MIAIERGYHVNRSIEKKKRTIPRISALPMNLRPFGRISMPVIHFSFWYSLGKWREGGVIVVGGTIMIMMV
jgi:hypothetical protein